MLEPIGPAKACCSARLLGQACSAPVPVLACARCDAAVMGMLGRCGHCLSCQTSRWTGTNSRWTEEPPATAAASATRLLGLPACSAPVMLTAAVGMPSRCGRCLSCQTAAATPATRLLDLPASALASVMAQLRVDDEPAAALSCSGLRQAIAARSRTRLLDLPADALASVAALLLADDEFAAALSCRALHSAAADAQSQNGRAGSTTHICSALESPSKLEWAIAHGLPRTDSAAGLAAGRGQLDALIILRERDYPLHEQTCLSAARGGHQAVLEWASSYCEWDSHIYDVAARHGHLPVLQWARASGFPWSSSTCWSAASGGHLGVLQWLHAAGCPWEETCQGAAEGDHLEVLQWARASGCPWNVHVCEHAAQRGDLPMLIWLRCNGCPWDAGTTIGAAGLGHLDVLQWARTNGCPYGPLTVEVARELMEGEGGVEGAGLAVEAVIETVVEWLRANGCPEGH